jgi:hypothetical protein
MGMKDVKYMNSEEKMQIHTCMKNTAAWSSKYLEELFFHWESQMVFIHILLC